jgi:hypothetical protein
VTQKEKDAEKNSGIRRTLLEFYHANEARFHVGFFLAGFILDYFASEEIANPFVLIHQFLYLTVIAYILSLEHLVESGATQIQRLRKVWPYRGWVLHFFLGTLLNLYSFFFFKSASIFSSIFYVLVLLAVLVANELPQIRKSGVNVRWTLWVVCLFSFFSVLFPHLLGFVGWMPFLLSVSATTLLLYVHFRLLMRYQKNLNEMFRSFLLPGLGILALFIGLYFFGLIPPVPLAVKHMGVYHQLEKVEGQYILSHEKAFWKIWQQGDQDFHARPGDSIYFFAEIFSPAHFSDEVTIHWLYKDPRAGWMTSDRVKMAISGGRHEGFRGYSVKRNYQPGDWRVQVETTDGREMGRLYLTIIPDPNQSPREWMQEYF